MHSDQWFRIKVDVDRVERLPHVPVGSSGEIPNAVSKRIKKKRLRKRFEEPSVSQGAVPHWWEFRGQRSAKP